MVMIDATATGLQNSKPQPGSQHSTLRLIDQTAQRHIGKSHSDVCQEYLIRDIGGDLRCCQCHDDGGHERKDVFQRNPENRGTKAFGSQIVLSVSDDDNLCTDEIGEVSQPVTVRANTMVQKLGVNSITSTEISNT